MAVTNAVSWRTEGIKYRKNEVFLDVIESVNLLANASGAILNSEIIGSIKMRVYLSVIERHAHSRVEIMVKAKSQFKRRSTANNVEIIIPVPADADSPRFKTSIGSVRYTPEVNSAVWTIKSFPGGKEFLMRAHFGLPSVTSEEIEGRPPIHVKFEIPYFTTSGIQVRYLKIIEKSGYQALPWVRYITQNGDYQLRTN
ncbi:AP-1 complex subunit mu-1 [Golovinomyces cichoracearum]|uniref:AP-1 complex subunit mu-1 n=1 Tax=Golovinomyces cichoracearum TaxID=62708 RepID=A0A420HQT6_9PEZI|nr:AP-1 complex subunit mu-1 [Golovinomyces cichoracearum]